jgi:hypothetical protein
MLTIKNETTETRTIVNCHIDPAIKCYGNCHDRKGRCIMLKQHPEFLPWYYAIYHGQTKQHCRKRPCLVCVVKEIFEVVLRCDLWKS